MEEAPENGKESSHLAHANEWMYEWIWHGNVSAVLGWLLLPYNQRILNKFFYVYDYIYSLHSHGTVTKKDSHHHHWSKIISYHFYCYSKFVINFWRYDRPQLCDAMGCTILWIIDFVAALFFWYFSVHAILLSPGLPFFKSKDTLFGRVVWLVK